MAKGKIDLDRGVIMRKHPAGMNVYMYVDAPGVYYDVFAREVPDAIAKDARFDTERFGRERMKRERMAKAMSQIEAELELAQSAQEEEVIATRGDYRVVKLPGGYANVIHSEGDVMNTTSIPQETAIRLMETLAGSNGGNEEPPVDETPKQKEKANGRSSS